MEDACSSILHLCSLLEKAGHTATVMSLDWKNQKIYHCGSGIGKNFLLENKDTVTNFVTYCSDMFSGKAEVSGEYETQDSLVTMDIGKFLSKHCTEDAKEGKDSKAENVPDHETFDEDEQDCSDVEELPTEDESHSGTLICNDIPETSMDYQECEQTIESSESKEQTEKIIDGEIKENSKDLDNTGKADFNNGISSLNKSAPNRVMTGPEQSEDDETFHEDNQVKMTLRSEMVTENGQEENANLNESQATEICGEKETEEKSKSNMHSCLFCDKQLKTRKILLRHVVIHAGKRLKCNACGTVCNKRDDLKMHLKIHHSEKNKLVKTPSAVKIKRKRQPKSASKLKTGNHLNGMSEVKSKTCHLCQVEFSTFHAQRRHMKCHKNLKVFKCYVCSKNFHTEKELASHTTVHEVSLVYSCGGCGLGFDSGQSLQYHRENSSCIATEAEEASSFKCSMCDKFFVYQKNFEKHLKFHERLQNTDKKMKMLENDTEHTEVKSEVSAPSIEICSDVKKEVETNTDQDAGSAVYTVFSKVRKSTSETSKSTSDLVCDLCGQIFKKALNLYRHKLEHDDMGMFPCRFCNFVAKTKDNLTRHSKKHLAQLPHICEICGKGFTEKCNLIFHVQSHSADRPYLCDDCGKSFRAHNSLVAHKRVHLGDRPFKCRYCMQTFTTNSTKREHEKLHLNKKNYMCDLCGSSFNQRCGLYTHKLTHHNRNPAEICPECGKAFKTQNHLRVHFVAKHLKLEDVESFGFRVYTCGVCQKLFSDKSDLKSHMNKHTGEKPFKCSYCSKCFSDKSNMRAHQRLHQDTRPHHCNVCGKGFLFNRDLKRHLKSHTPQDISEDPDKLQESATAVEFLNSSLTTSDCEPVQVHSSNAVEDFSIYTGADNDYMFR